MNKAQENKINLVLKYFLDSIRGYEYEPIYLEIYNSYDIIFQKTFAYFHQIFNMLFKFMNHKSEINYHYNATESRELINIISKLRDLKMNLKNSDYDFEINNSYIKQIQLANSFLNNSRGSTIPKDYKSFNVIKYEPIFKLKNKDINFSNFDYSINNQASFEVDTITIKINEKILKHVKTLLESSHYSNAVEEAYKIVRKKLKSITGKEKAHEGFQKNNYEKIFGREPRDDAELDFFEGVKFLHMAIQKLRNEKAHTPAKNIDKNLAIHYIVLASLAYDLIDN